MLCLKLREEARTVFLQKKSKELLDNNELQVVLHNQYLSSVRLLIIWFFGLLTEFMDSLGQES